MLHLRVVCPDGPRRRGRSTLLTRPGRRRRRRGQRRLDARRRRHAPIWPASAPTGVLDDLHRARRRRRGHGRARPDRRRVRRAGRHGRARRARRGRRRAHLGRADRAHRRGLHPDLDVRRVHGAGHPAGRASASSPTRRSRSSARWSSARSSARSPAWRSALVRRRAAIARRGARRPARRLRGGDRRRSRCSRCWHARSAWSTPSDLTGAARRPTSSTTRAGSR